MIHHRKHARELAERQAAALESVSEERLADYREKVRGLRARLEQEREDHADSEHELRDALERETAARAAAEAEAHEVAVLLDAALARVDELEAAFAAAVEVKRLIAPESVVEAGEAEVADPPQLEDKSPARGRKANVKGGGE